VTAPLVTRSISAQLFGGTGRSPLIHWLTIGGDTSIATARADWLPTMAQASATAVCVAVLMPLM